MNEKGRRKWKKLDCEVAIECRIRAENDGVNWVRNYICTGWKRTCLKLLRRT